MASETLSEQKLQHIIDRYTTANPNGRYPTLTEVGEKFGYSAAALSRILKDAGIRVTRGKRVMGTESRDEFEGKIRGRFQRHEITVSKLRERRKALKITAKAIAEVLGQYTAWASNIENNMLRATPQRIRAFADAIEALNPKRGRNTHAVYMQRCREFVDSDSIVKAGHKKRKKGSWGTFVAGLSKKDLDALKQAIRRDAGKTRMKFAA